MRYIKFSVNHNNKLATNYFTTIRIHRPNAYIQGRDYTILIEREAAFTAELKTCDTMKLKDVPKYVICADTGLDYTSYIELFRRFLKKKSKQEALETDVDVLLLKRIAPVIPLSSSQILTYLKRERKAENGKV